MSNIQLPHFYFKKCCHIWRNRCYCINRFIKAKLDKSKFEATPVSLPEAEKEASREVAKFSAKKSVNTAEQKYVGLTLVLTLRRHQPS